MINIRIEKYNDKNGKNILEKGKLMSMLLFGLFCMKE